MTWSSKDNTTQHDLWLKGGFANGFDTFQGFVRPDQIISFLGHDPRPQNWSNLTKSIQNQYRKLDQKRTKTAFKTMAAYLENNMSPSAQLKGLFGAITVFHKQPIKLEPTSDKTHRNIGYLKLPHDRLLIDGMARVSALIDLLHTEDQRYSWLKKKTQIPVTLVAPHKTTDIDLDETISTLIHDLNFVGSWVSASSQVANNASNAYVKIAANLGELAVIEQNGGVERYGSINEKSKRIVTRQMLIKYVECAWLGINPNESGTRLTNQGPAPFKDDEFERLKHTSVQFLKTFAATMGDSFGYMNVPDIVKRREKRREALHLHMGSWKVLGCLCAELLQPRTKERGSETINKHARKVANYFLKHPRDKLGLITKVNRNGRITHRFDKAAQCRLLFHDILKQI